MTALIRLRAYVEPVGRKKITGFPPGSMVRYLPIPFPPSKTTNRTAYPMKTSKAAGPGFQELSIRGFDPECLTAALPQVRGKTQS